VDKIVQNSSGEFFLEHDLLVILKKIIGLPRCPNVIQNFTSDIAESEILDKGCMILWWDCCQKWRQLLNKIASLWQSGN